MFTVYSVKVSIDGKPGEQMIVASAASSISVSHDFQTAVRYRPGSFIWIRFGLVSLRRRTSSAV
ncbi:MAG: hypothetical protein ACK449_17875 [Planctomycetota bacterium]